MLLLTLLIACLCASANVTKPKVYNTRATYYFRTLPPTEAQKGYLYGTPKPTTRYTPTTKSSKSTKTTTTSSKSTKTTTSSKSTKTTTSKSTKTTTTTSKKSQATRMPQTGSNLGKVVGGN